MERLIEKDLCEGLKNSSKRLAVSVNWEVKYRMYLTSGDKYMEPSKHKDCQNKHKERLADTYKDLLRVKSIVSLMIEQFNDSLKTDEIIKTDGVDSII